MRVKVKNDNIARALRIFKRKTSDIVYEYKKRRFYEKPSEVRHKAKKAARNRHLKRINDGK